jgi:dolichyl-phosphate-mannose-protein mannosyltransferase
VSVNENHFSTLLFRISLAGILLGVVATLYFLAGLAGYVGNTLLNVLVAANLAAAALFFLTVFFQSLRETNWVGRTFWLAVLVILGAEIVLCLVPPTARDELTHHLAIPRLYAEAGRIIEVPIAPYSYYPMLLEMFYTPWVYWGYDSVPKLIHALFGFLTGLCLYAYLSRRMNAVYGMLGFFLFISIPSILRLSHWAYVDLGTTFYATASLLCLLRWREDREASRWLLLSALSAGFSVATKPNGLVAWLVLGLLFMFTEVSEPKRGFAKIAGELCLFVLAGVLPFLPWVTKNWLQTGNPFFPLLANFFPAKSAVGGGGPASFTGLGLFAKRELLYGESGWQIAALPLRVFFFGRDDNPQYFDGVLTPMLILFLPWAFKGKWSDEKKLLIGFALLYFAYALFLVDLRVRYILPIVPPLVILLVYSIFNIYLRIKRPAYLFAVLLFFIGLNGFYLWRYFQEVAPMAYLTGQESREAYLAGALPEYPVFQYINHELPPTAKIYLLFIGRRAYYCQRDYFHDGGELPGLLLTAIQSAKSPVQIEKTLRARNITHLMIRGGLLEQFLNYNLNASQRAVWDSFIARHLQLRFEERGYALYQLYG